jgi:hypothetical protein
MSAVIKPFRIAVGDEVLDDLRSRLRSTRWPEAELVADWSQGAPLQWIQDMCRYWAEDYDWRAVKRCSIVSRNSSPTSKGSTSTSFMRVRRTLRRCRW